MSESTALRGAELARAAINQILDHPDEWDQTNWHSTKHCFFGHCQILGDCEQDRLTCFKEVTELLGISTKDANWLSQPNRSLSDLHAYVAALIVEKENEFFDQNGYPRDGYDQNGYDRDGYDQNGYDRTGYDQNGYDQNGYPRTGYDRTGYNQTGYDQNGYNRNGYDRNGKQLPRL